MIDLLHRFLAELKNDLARHSNLDIDATTPLEITISVPANANNNQRFLTAEGFRLAGFEVAGVINEPTAAGIEYVNRFGVKGARSRKHYLLVYDLGGGTFDVSIIGIGEHRYETLATEGIMRLGGDDFDQVLCELALAAAHLNEAPTATQRAILLDECREKKESLHANTRKIAIDLERAMLGAGDVTVLVSDFFAQCRPLIDKTLALVHRSLQDTQKTTGIGLDELSSVYVVGGGSHFPLVNRQLRKAFSRLASRSAYPHGAAAVGLAVALDNAARLELKEQFTRDFGVWRESESGAEIVLDRIFHKGTALPGKAEPPLVVTRTYLPSHNIGHYRFVECGRLTDDGRPTDDLSLLDDIRFPFDPQLQSGRKLDDIPVTAFAQRAQRPVEETYYCDSDGMIQVIIKDTDSGYQRQYLLAGGDSDPLGGSNMAEVA